MGCAKAGQDKGASGVSGHVFTPEKPPTHEAPG